MDFHLKKQLELMPEYQGFGKIHRFDAYSKMTHLNDKQVERVYRKYEQIVEDEFLKLMTLREFYFEDFEAKEYVCWNWTFIFFDKLIFEQQMRKYLFEDRLGMLEAFEKTCVDGIRDNYYASVVNFLKHKDLFKRGVQYVMKTLSNAIYRYLLEQSFRSVRGSFIFYDDTFRREHFSYIPKNLKGFIFKEVGPIKHLISLSNELGVPTCIGSIPNEYQSNVLITAAKNEIILEPSQTAINQYKKRLSEINTKYFEPHDERYDGFKLYLKQGNIHDISKYSNSDWIQGLCFYKPQHIYSTTGAMARSIDVFKDIEQINLLMKDKELFVTLPDLKPGRTISLINKYYLETDLHEDFPNVINEFLKGILEVSIKHKRTINLVVPQVRDKEDYEYWKMVIEIRFMSNKEYMPKVGIAYDTEHTVNAYDEFDDMDFVVIDIDSLIENYMGKSRYSKIDEEDFLLRLGHEMRWIHQHFRQYLTKKRHIVHGQCFCDNPFIFRKLVNRGLREFAIPARSIETIRGVLDDYVETRGKFVGVSQARRKRRQQAQNSSKIPGDKQEHDENLS